MKWITEYKQSLKNIDAEEPLDIFFFRPIAFVIVKLLYSLPLTPNHYSLMSLICGTFSAYCFYLGTQSALSRGALAFLLFAVFDCCDGMIARLKKNGTEFGRLIDGLVDYTVNFTVYACLAIGIGKLYPELRSYAWILVVLAGLSKAMQAISFDRHLCEYLAYARGDMGFLKKEMAEIRFKLLEAQKNRSSAWRILALKIYLIYSSIQAGKPVQGPKYSPSLYCRRNQKILRMWSLIGPAVHVAILILALLLNIPHLLFFYAIGFGNAWLVFMIFYQRNSNALLCAGQESAL